MQTVGSASEAAATVNLAMQRIKEKLDLPEAIDLQTDNGPKFKQAFANALEDDSITVSHGPAYTSTMSLSPYSSVP